MAKKRKIAAILARVSRPTQSLDSQVNDLLRVANDKGYEVPQEFVFTEKITGMDAGFKRSLNKLLTALENPRNHIEAVFIWEVQRLNRGAYDFATELSQLNSKGVPIYFNDLEIWTWDFENNVISKENCDKLIGASIYGRTEWEKIAKRTKRGRDAVAEKGYYIGHLADGYIAVKEEGNDHKSIKVDNERKEVIKKIFDLYVNGNSTDTIAKILNSEGVMTTNHYRLSTPQFFNYKRTYKKRENRFEYERSDSQWQGTLVTQILSNSWYIGERIYAGKPYQIEPIIDRDIWEKAKEIREKRAISFRTDKTSQKHNYLLGGLVFCGKCGNKMYGHTTGLNNHYYCSSADEGNKCGTRGCCKENLEAIVANVVLAKAFNEVLNGEETEITQFFRLDENEKNRLKTEIKKYKGLLEDLEQQIKLKEEEYDEAVRLQVVYMNDTRRVQVYEKMIKEADTKLMQFKEEKIKLEGKILLNQKRLNSEKKIGNVLEKINSKHELNELKELFHTAIEKVYIYNYDANITIIRIVYLNGKIDEVIYSYRLIKNNFILIPFPLHYNPTTNRLVCADGYPVRINETGLIITTQKGGFSDDEKKLLDEVNSERFPKEDYQRIEISEEKFLAQSFGDLYSFDNEIEIDEYVKLIRSSDCVQPFERLEEQTEDAKVQDQKYKEWRKKYNNGLPTTLPFVVRDGNYEEYLRQRKHLYNRKWKIKKNKRLTETQKNEELEKIESALSLLRAKVKYLSRDEAVKVYQKKKKEAK